MNKPQDYKHIQAWGRLLHSDPGYILDEQYKAAEDDAPIDAVYEKTDYSEDRWLPRRKWYRYADVTNAETRFEMDKLLGGAK